MRKDLTQLEFQVMQTIKTNHTIKVLENIYRGSTANINLHQNREKISIKNEVRQSNTISPRLFRACLEEVIENIDWEDVGI